MPRRKDPTQQRKSMPWRGREGGLDKPRVSRGVANLRHGEGLHHSIVVLHRSVTTVHNMEIFVFLFFFVFPLLRGLVYWFNENPISV